MPRPRKDKPHHSSGMYEYKATIGHTFDGKPIRKSFYSKTSREAAKAKANEYIINMKVAEQTGEVYCDNKVTFKKQADIVLKIKKEKVRQNTYELHWKNVINNHLLPYFGNARLIDIKKNDIELYLQSKNDLAKATLKSHLNVLNEIFNNAVDNDIIAKNPCNNVHVEIGTQTAEKRVYTKEQADLVLEYCKQHRFGLEVDLLLRYGLSRSEMLGITWDSVDTENKTIEIRQGITNGQGAGNQRVIVSDTKNKYRNRIIAISDETVNLILNHPSTIVVGKNVHKKTTGKEIRPEFLIYNRFGKACSPDKWYTRHYKVFMEDMREYYLNQDNPIDIPILNPHELRHTRASIWVNEGKNLFAIADQMGWSDLDMLRKRYAHGDINQLRKQLDL